MRNDAGEVGRGRTREHLGGHRFAETGKEREVKGKQ